LAHIWHTLKIEVSQTAVVTNTRELCNHRINEPLRYLSLFISIYLSVYLCMVEPSL
jgi:hypothetical protein